jgi:hypothetical protein
MHSVPSKHKPCASLRRDSIDLVLLQLSDVFDDTCLSKPRYYGRSIVVEALDDICSFSEVGRCLIDLFFLCLEEKVLLVCCVFCSGVETAYSNFEVPLPFSSFEEPLAYLITFPEFVSRMSLLRSYVTTALGIAGPVHRYLCTSSHRNRSAVYPRVFGQASGILPRIRQERRR